MATKHELPPAVTALKLAARPEGVTASQLSDNTGLSRDHSGRVLKNLVGNTGRRDLGDLGILTRKRELLTTAPGAPEWRYWLRKRT